MDESIKKQWQDGLEDGSHLIKVSKIKLVLANRIISLTKIGNKWVLIGYNYADNEIRLENTTEKAVLKDLATLNGYTYE